MDINYIDLVCSEFRPTS